ncbi:MAG: hypothetical protein HOL85_04955 [Rhodospirillaceae bacterium]|jgi:hypothetical protein|nr:hypothetical protein [Rhodospirillaceae bacterium]
MKVIRLAIIASVLLLMAALPASAQQQSAPVAGDSATQEQLNQMQASIDEIRKQLKQLGTSARSWMNHGGMTSLTPEQWTAIAVGAVSGALIVDALGGGGLVSLAGAAIGGYTGHWIISAPPVQGAK